MGRELVREGRQLTAGVVGALGEVVVVHDQRADAWRSVVDGGKA
jgi:hypothetical protein